MLSRCNRFAVSVIGAQKAEARMGFRHMTGREFEQVSDQRSLLRKPQVGRPTGIYRLEQKDGGGAVYDGAGRKTSNQFTTNLDRPYSTKSSQGKLRSRVMYGTMLANMDLVQEVIDNAISKTNKIVQDNILRNAA
jgi:hypothetical protein